MICNLYIIKGGEGSNRHLFKGGDPSLWHEQLRKTMQALRVCTVGAVFHQELLTA